MRLAGARIRAELPPGWEGRIDDGGLETLADGAVRPNLVHLANFPLPAGIGDFGSGATETMLAGDVFITLFEYDPAAAGTALFAVPGLPRSLAAADFDRNNLQRTLPGQSGVQRFFHHQGRAFCLYVVVGSHLDRVDRLPGIAWVLERLEIDP